LVSHSPVFVSGSLLSEMKSTTDFTDDTDVLRDVRSCDECFHLSVESVSSVVKDSSALHAAPLSASLAVTRCLSFLLDASHRKRRWTNQRWTDTLGQKPGDCNPRVGS
jgi:hypothetical protein